MALPLPSLEPYRNGYAGVDHVACLDSGRPGPHAAITALVHGNEICGAIALDAMLRKGVRPRRGRLSLAFVNVAAYQAYDPARPEAGRFLEEDLNRVWSSETLDGPRTSRELERARALRPVIDAADYLLDIHSMQVARHPLLLAGPLAKGRELAVTLGTEATIVCDAGHRAGRRLRDYGGFGDPASPRNAALIECGEHTDPEAPARALDAAFRFLLHLDMIDPHIARPFLRSVPRHGPSVIEVTHAVTIGSDAFRFLAEYAGMEVIPCAGTLIARDDAEPVATPYDDCVLIMPTRRLRRGETAIRFGRFVA